MTENSGKHIQFIIETVPCKRHRADQGEACWYIPGLSGILRAVCSRRTRLVWNREPGKPIAKVNHGYRGQKKEVVK